MKRFISLLLAIFAQGIHLGWADSDSFIPADLPLTIQKYVEISEDSARFKPTFTSLSPERQALLIEDLLQSADISPETLSNLLFQSQQQNVIRQAVSSIQLASETNEIGPASELMTHAATLLFQAGMVDQGNAVLIETEKRLIQSGEIVRAHLLRAYTDQLQGSDDLAIREYESIISVMGVDSEIGKIAQIQLESLLVARQEQKTQESLINLFNFAAQTMVHVETVARLSKTGDMFGIFGPGWFEGRGTPETDYRWISGMALFKRLSEIAISYKTKTPEETILKLKELASEAVPTTSNERLEYIRVRSGEIPSSVLVSDFKGTESFALASQESAILSPSYQTCASDQDSCARELALCRVGAVPEGGFRAIHRVILNGGDLTIENLPDDTCVPIELSSPGGGRIRQKGSDYYAPICEKGMLFASGGRVRKYQTRLDKECSPVAKTFSDLNPSQDRELLKVWNENPIYHEIFNLWDGGDAAKASLAQKFRDEWSPAVAEFILSDLPPETTVPENGKAVGEVLAEIQGTAFWSLADQTILSLPNYFVDVLAITASGGASAFGRGMVMVGLKRTALRSVVTGGGRLAILGGKTATTVAGFGAEVFIFNTLYGTYAWYQGHSIWKEGYLRSLVSTAIVLGCIRAGGYLWTKALGNRLTHQSTLAVESLAKRKTKEALEKQAISPAQKLPEINYTFVEMARAKAGYKILNGLGSVTVTSHAMYLGELGRSWLHLTHIEQDGYAEGITAALLFVLCQRYLGDLAMNRVTHDFLPKALDRVRFQTELLEKMRAEVPRNRPPFFISTRLADNEFRRFIEANAEVGSDYVEFPVEVTQRGITELVNIRLPSQMISPYDPSQVRLDPLFNSQGLFDGVQAFIPTNPAPFLRYKLLIDGTVLREWYSVNFVFWRHLTLEGKIIRQDKLQERGLVAPRARPIKGVPSDEARSNEDATGTRVLRRDRFRVSPFYELTDFHARMSRIYDRYRTEMDEFNRLSPQEKSQLRFVFEEISRDVEDFLDTLATTPKGKRVVQIVRNLRYMDRQWLNLDQEKAIKNYLNRLLLLKPGELPESLGYLEEADGSIRLGTVRLSHRFYINEIRRLTDEIRNRNDAIGRRQTESEIDELLKLTPDVWGAMFRRADVFLLVRGGRKYTALVDGSLRDSDYRIVPVLEILQEYRSEFGENESHYQSLLHQVEARLREVPAEVLHKGTYSIRSHEGMSREITRQVIREWLEGLKIILDPGSPYSQEISKVEDRVTSEIRKLAELTPKENKRARQLISNIKQFAKGQAVAGLTPRQVEHLKNHVELIDATRVPKPFQELFKDLKDRTKTETYIRSMMGCKTNQQAEGVLKVTDLQDGTYAKEGEILENRDANILISELLSFSRRSQLSDVEISGRVASIHSRANALMLGSAEYAPQLWEIPVLGIQTRWIDYARGKLYVSSSLRQNGVTGVAEEANKRQQQKDYYARDGFISWLSTYLEESSFSMFSKQRAWDVSWKVYQHILPEDYVLAAKLALQDPGAGLSRAANYSRHLIEMNAAVGAEGSPEFRMERQLAFFQTQIQAELRAAEQRNENHLLMVIWGAAMMLSWLDDQKEEETGAPIEVLPPDTTKSDSAGAHLPSR